ncbi:MAG: hypothetical protein M1840_000872 [Geoglossum simile]|nr:MAG: hypothetical protein M1840_000872 [Geoglossum simile]
MLFSFPAAEQVLQTGLSQVRNLYFVAYGHQIWVYQPRFPTQVLRTCPDLILTLPVSQGGLVGYIDPENPHSINQLVVGDLGGEEIMACVCDDGDVLAYQTQKILAAIERRTANERLHRDEGDHVRPFFNENVGESAWGLAIHKSARMIAVSANTKDITVFAFALATESSTAYAQALEKNVLPSESINWVPIDSNSPISTSFYAYPSSGASRLLLRQQNYRITLRGHRDNIPCVAFYNSQDDTRGRWLISTDIECVVVVWDIWCRKVVKRTKFIDQIPLGQFGNTTSTDESGGWGVLCLDPRSLKPTLGHEETFGCDPVPHHGKHITMWSAAWDITGSKGEVSDSSFWHPSYSMYDDGEFMFGEMFDDVPLTYGVDDEDEDDDMEFPYWEPSLQGAGNQSDPDQGMGGQDHVIPHEIYHDSEDAHTLAIIHTSLTNIYDNQSVQTGDFSSTVQHNASVGQQSLVGSTSMAPGDAFSEHLLKSYPQLPPERPVDLPDDLPDFPVLFSTGKHIRLLQSPSLRASTICRKALEQNIPPHLGWLSQYGRLNMVAQIPDLSLAIVGSQSGRVALLTLTTSQSIPDKYAFRLEALLPFKSQEKGGLRPDVPLVGLAVAPIQGRELAVDRSTMTDVSAGLGSRSRTEAWRRVERTRRYRLMVMYCSGSVLSYELRRDGERVSVEGTGGQLLAL